jgi:hypothetical protein
VKRSEGSEGLSFLMRVCSFFFFFFFFHPLPGVLGSLLCISLSQTKREQQRERVRVGIQIKAAVASAFSHPLTLSRLKMDVANILFFLGENKEGYLFVYRLMLTTWPECLVPAFLFSPPTNDRRTKGANVHPFHSISVRSTRTKKKKLKSFSVVLLYRTVRS